MTDAGHAPGRWAAADLIGMLTDGGSFTAWDEDLVPGDPLRFTDVRPYAERLEDARRGAPTTEAVVTGVGRLGGRHVVLVVGEFGFLAGTQGVVVGERVTRAFDRATVRGLPIVGLPTSGGTRMQEGALAFVQMLKIAAAVSAFRRSGNRYVAWLRNPTTGGVLASWGSLAHVTWAQPGALIGLTGPRVIAALEGSALPEHVQRAEHLHSHGVVDGVVPADELRQCLAHTLDAVGPPSPALGPPRYIWPTDSAPAPPADAGAARTDAWTAVTASRRGDRPGLPDLLDSAVRDRVLLRGDGAGGRDDGCVTAVCTWHGTPVVVVGHDRPAGGRGAAVGAAGYRAARRAMCLANELGLPIVTVVDTRGAATNAAAESGGLAAEIARCMVTMSAVAYRRSRSCWGRAPAAARSPGSPPTGWWPRGGHGWHPSLRRARRRSCTARPTGQPTSPAPRPSTSTPSSGWGWSTRSCRRTTAGSPRSRTLSPTSCACCWHSRARSVSRRGGTVCATSAHPPNVAPDLTTGCRLPRCRGCGGAAMRCRCRLPRRGGQSSERYNSAVRSAMLDHANSLSTRWRPARPNAAARSGSSTRSLMPAARSRAKASGSAGVP